MPVPGGSTSASPRAGVDTYSRATHSPSRTSASGTSASSAESGSTSRSGGSSLELGQVDHDAEQPPAPERDDEHAAHPDAGELAAEPVVERPAQGARRGQRLDLGDHRPDATRAADLAVPRPAIQRAMRRLEPLERLVAHGRQPELVAGSQSACQTAVGWPRSNSSRK